jgi:hypothetical protein
LKLGEKMKTRWLPISIIVILTLLLNACQAKLPGSTSNQTFNQTAGAGPALLTGSFTYTNDFVIETYYVEQAVAINDLKITREPSAWLFRSCRKVC